MSNIFKLINFFIKKMIIRSIVLILFIFFCLTDCKKDEEILYPETDRTITITDKIVIDNGVKIHDQIFNLINYDKFLHYLSASDHFLIVPLKDFENTESTDKVVLTLRYDIDDNINAAVKFAYREHKYGIKSTFFVLHTTNYYCITLRRSFFERNDNIVYYLKKIQDSFGHEIGLHNDLVTLQVVYNIPPKEFLHNELAWLRGNGINISGTAYHGSPYCYLYHYSNASFWKEYPDGGGWNYEYVKKGYTTYKIEKDSLKNYDFEYEGGLLNQDYVFSDADSKDGKRWNMGMVNLDTIKPGKKVIIILHPQHWD
jgi:hypothetical protein